MVVTQDMDEAAAGGQAAFVALVDPVLPAAYRLALGMLRSETEAEDAVQEAVFKAWRGHRRFRPGAEMKPWLLAILANECRRVRRNRWWTVVTSGSAQPELPEQISPDGGADAVGLRRAIYRLPHDQKLAVVLRYYLDLSFDEMAEILKISPKAAKSRIYRALERLRLSPEVLSDE